MSKTKSFPKRLLGSLQAKILAAAYFNTVIVYLLWTTILWPVKYIYSPFYIKLDKFLFACAAAYLTTCIHIAGYKIEESGDDITACLDKYALVLPNHFSMTDVPMLMALFTSKPNVTSNSMWTLAEYLKYTSFGLVCLRHGDVFISSGTGSRESSVTILRNHLERVFKRNDRKWIVLFPEGYLLRNNKEASQKYAAANGLPHLEHVSLPRSGATKTILDTLHADDDEQQNFLDYVLDITIIYPNGKPLLIYNFFDGMGDPCVIHFHYKLYKIKDIPRDDKSLKKWLYERFYEKEKMLKESIQSGSFKTGESPVRSVHQDNMKLFLVNLFYFASIFLHYFLFRSIFSVIIELF